MQAESMLKYYGLLDNTAKGFLPYLKGKEDDYINTIKNSTWII